MLAGNWDSHSDHRTFSIRTGDINLPSGQMGAFSHAQEAKCALTRLLLAGNSASVVTDRQDDCAVLLFQLNVYSCRLRMTKDIGQRFLTDAEGGR